MNIRPALNPTIDTDVGYLAILKNSISNIHFEKFSLVVQLGCPQNFPSSNTVGALTESTRSQRPKRASLKELTNDFICRA